MIWDTVRLLWFHPAHGLGGDACAMVSCCCTWPNCAISDAGSVASCGGKPISKTSECQPVCIWTIAPPSDDSETGALPSEPPATLARFQGLRILSSSSAEYPGSAGKCSRTNRKKRLVITVLVGEFENVTLNRPNEEDSSVERASFSKSDVDLSSNLEANPLGSRGISVAGLSIHFSSSSS